MKLSQAASPQAAVLVDHLTARVYVWEPEMPTTVQPLALVRDTAGHAQSAHQAVLHVQNVLTAMNLGQITPDEAADVLRAAGGRLRSMLVDACYTPITDPPVLTLERESMFEPGDELGGPGQAEAVRRIQRLMDRDRHDLLELPVPGCTCDGCLHAAGTVALEGAMAP